VAASGDFRWPPMGRFPWPPSSNDELVRSFEEEELGNWLPAKARRSRTTRTRYFVGQFGTDEQADVTVVAPREISWLQSIVRCEPSPPGRLTRSATCVASLRRPGRASNRVVSQRRRLDFQEAVDRYIADVRSESRIRSPHSEAAYRHKLRCHGGDVSWKDPRETDRRNVKRTLSPWEHPNSRNQALATLRSFSDYLIFEGFRDTNPARQVATARNPPAQPFRLTAKEMGLVLDGESARALGRPPRCVRRPSLIGDPPSEAGAPRSRRVRLGR
jgi:hypothetical protein